MSWSVQAVILGCEMVLGYVLGRVFIPYFRRIKTGKFDFYIGDRFAKDGSEPKFGGVVIMLCVIFGIVTGVIFYDSQAAKKEVCENHGVKSAKGKEKCRYYR